MDITILDEGAGGLFALSGKQQAIVMIKPKDEIVETFTEHVINPAKRDEGFSACGSVKNLALSNSEGSNSSVVTPDYTLIQRQIKKELSALLKRAGIPFDRINTSIITGRIFINIISKAANQTNLAPNIIRKSPKITILLR